MNNNSGIINTGKIGGNVTNIHKITTLALPGGDGDELKKLETQLREMLAKMDKQDPEAAGAIKDSLDEMLNKVQAEKPNKTSIRISAEGLRSAAGAIEGVLPIALRIVGVIGTAFGFTL